MNYNDDFLKLISRPLDDSQYKALSQEGNTVIAAGAGSGKTQVLATRFAWLVLTGQAEAPQILTLTFTNKAASEMYQRIYKTLIFFAEHEECKELSSIEIQRAKNALEAFSETHIQTLDSYCASIVRQCANRYGIKPDFTSGSGDGERLVKDAALKFILQNMENHAVLAFSNPGDIQNFAENTFANIIINNTSLASPEGYFIKSLKKQTETICQAWNKYILGKTEGSLSAMVDIVKNALEESSKKDDSDKALYVKQLEKLFETAYALEELAKITIEDIEKKRQIIKDSLDSFDLLFNEINITQSAKGKIKDVGTCVTKLRDKMREYNSIAAFIRQYEEIHEMNRLFDEFLNQINKEKRTSGNLSFFDISEMALVILRENEDIRNQEKRAYRKIMIDEFQDNNGKNRDLLYLLSLKDGEFEDNGHCKIEIPEGKALHELLIIKKEEGNIIEDFREKGKLFFVGDEKQSIYKFRGADVTVFNELTQGGENNLVYMTYNYRSTAALVKAFNTIFKNGNGIFDTYDTLSKKDFEAYYEKDASKNGEELPELNTENIPVHMHLFNKAEISENEKALPEKRKKLLPEKDQMAYFIAKKIRMLHDSKGIDWNDFAILDRARTDRGTLIKYLSLFGIPYTVDVFKDIFQDGIVNDFYNFLRICVYPSDINAFAAYLCSPLAGLSENSVEIIISHLNSPSLSDDGYMKYTFNPYDDKESQLRSDLGEREFTKYSKAMALYRDFRPQVLRQRLTTSLSFLWNDMGYKYDTMLSDNLILCAEQFDMLFELARQTEESGKSTSWFIDQLETIRNNSFLDDSDLNAADISYPYERGQAVEIMTIHKSKGLQFEHVFIYGCTGIISKTSDKNYFFNEEYGVSLKTDKDTGNYFFNMSRELEKQKEIAELRRLIYVAITRAVSSVYIVGSISFNTSSESGLRLIENAVFKYYDDQSEYSFVEQAGFDLTFIKAVEYSDLPDEGDTSPQTLKALLLKSAAAEYDKAPLIEHKACPILRKTPSSLESISSKNVDKASAALEEREEASILKYEESSDLLRSADFTAADFGTLVHAYLEMQAKGIGPEEYEPEAKYFKNLSEAKIKEKKSECIKFCAEFAECEIGKAFSSAKAAGRFWRAEWGFRMFWKCDEAADGAIFTGSIDLIFENEDGTYTICDYKSDTEIEPEIYKKQQECYRAAASRMLGVKEEKILLNLYYLRHQEIVFL